MADTTARTLLDFERAITGTIVTDVRISPDGGRIAYVTALLSKDEGPPTSTIWLIDAAGGPARRLTGGEAGDGSPRWSPDGARLAFVSDRKERGKPQLYLLDLAAGGEAVRLTNHESGIGAPEWSPDGALLAYTALSSASDEEKAHKEQHDELAVDEWVKRASLYVLTVPDDPAGLAPDDLPTSKRLTPDDRHVGGFTGGGFSWAPDSKGLVAVLGRSPKAEDMTVADIALVDLDGALTLLGQFDFPGTPKFSPDGSTLAFVGPDGQLPATGALLTMPVQGGKPTVLLRGIECTFQSVDWLSDGNRLLAQVEEGQRNRITIVDPESKALAVADAFQPLDTPVTYGSWFGPGYSLTPDGARIAFIAAHDASLGDLYVADLGGTPKQLTDLNPWTRDYAFGETREISWTSSDGLEIQGLLILPVGYQEGVRYPLVTQIHGGPAGAWTHHLYANWHDWGQFLAQRGYAVFMPNPRGSTGRGTEFLCGIVGCYGEPDWQDIMTGVDYLIEQGIADADQLVVGGWSGGGFLTNWSITHTDRFKAAVSGAGIANWVSFQGTADIRTVFDRYLGRVDEEPEGHWRLSPIRYIQHAVTPTLILYGACDDRVPPSQGHEMYEGLKSRSVETKLVLYPREPHIILERKHQLDLLTRVVDWFDSHLGR